MSKIGKMPVKIEEGSTVTVENGEIKVTGPKGTLSFIFPKSIQVAVEEGNIIVSQKEVSQTTRALFGLVRAQIANMVEGATKGFEKKLELSGVGYRAQTNGTELTVSVGFSHPVKIKAPEGITYAVAENVITVAGSDKSLVGDTAAKIRRVRPPEPYKGKGISYQGERIRRKVGKAAKAVGAK